MMCKTNYPCVFLINDIHVSKDNIPDFIANWNEALSVCGQYGITLIVVGGDLFQSRSSQTLDVLLAVYDALNFAKAQGIKVVLANGNHDLVNQEAIRGYCHVFGEHENVELVNETLTLGENVGWDFLLHVIPYFPENGSFIEKLDFISENRKSSNKLNYLYIHEGINGALSQPAEKELPPSIFCDFDKTLVGHYHNRCVIPKTNIEYIGSSRQHNFGEEEEKGYTIIYSDGSQKFIKNEVNLRYKTIDVPFEKVDIHLMDLLQEIKSDGRYRVRLRVHSNAAKVASIDKKKLIDAGANKVEIVTETMETVEISASGLFEKFDSNKMMKTYEEFCQEKEIIDVALGLSYLSKIENTCGS